MFLAEAVLTAVYLQNRNPTKAVHGSTPFGAWTEEKPRLEHLCRFRCAVYGKKCILVGYGVSTKGYRLYDYEKRRVFYSRDVVFNEEENGLEKEISELNSQHNHHISIELSTDEVTEGSIDENGSINAGETGFSKEAEQPQLRQSTRERRPPDYYGVWVNVDEEKDLTNREEALAGKDKKKWESAMKKEMQSMETNDVWDLVKLPEGQKPVGCKWIFKRKLNSDGIVERYKARLVAQGFSQKYGQDYDKTFAPVVRFESV